MADLDAQVRAADPDRWLSSRFVGDARSRADLIAFYAFEAELTAIPSRVSQPLLAEMRFVWWRDQLDGAFAGVARKGHPVLEALTDLIARHALPRAPFDALIEAHIGRVHRQPHDLDALFVGPMQTAASILAGPGQDERLVTPGRLWGLIRTGRGDEAAAMKSKANRVLAGLPAKAFPAVGHATLDRDIPENLKRIRLVWATLRGRL